MNRKLSLVLVALASLPALAQSLTPHQPTWVVSWSAAQQIPEPQNALPTDDLRDTTLRQIFHLSIGGQALRVHISNTFGTTPLHLTSAHIARPISPATSDIDPAADKPLTFARHADVTIPPGAEMLSDPIEAPIPALSDIAVTIHYDQPPSRQTSHPGSRATSYYVHGDATSSPNLVPRLSVREHGQDSVGDCNPSAFTVDQHPAANPCSSVPQQPKKVDHWYQISAIDVLTPTPAAAIVALGDSITDGHGATTNGNDRWTDILAARLLAAASLPTPDTPHPRLYVGVANAGIGGNHLLTDGLGPNALARFDRDVLAQAGVRYLIVLEGVNDLGGLAIHGEVPPSDHAALVDQILAAYQQIIVRAHAHGIRVYGATITPYVGSAYYHPGPLSEADRQAVNTWIRGGHFDAVLDFDAVVRDPEHSDQLLAAYDCGDHLHPSPAGYRAIANSIPLSLFTQ